MALYTNCMFHGETNKRAEVGKIGEDIAEKFLVEQGYEIVDRNVRQKFGEIDILAEDRFGTAHFVEVKTLSAKSWLEPEDQLTRSKLLKMKKMADWYARQNPKTVSGNYQLDLVAIKFSEEGGRPEIRFYENIA